MVEYNCDLKLYDVHQIASQEDFITLYHILVKFHQFLFSLYSPNN